MNNDSQFEKRLRDQVVKTVPGEWRADILRKAALAARNRNDALAGHVSWFEVLRSRLAALLWPAPRAWAALATVWVSILVMNVSGGPESTTTAPQIPAAQARMALKQKQLLMAELAGRTESREAIKPQPASPSPRSQRREEASAA